MKLLRELDNFILKILSVLTGALLVGMVVILTIQIVSRSFLGIGLNWTEEGARMLMIVLSYMGAAVISLDGKHVNISVLEDACKGNAKKAVIIVQEIIMLAFLVLLFRFSIPAIKVSMLSVTPNLGINWGIIYSSIPVSCVLMGLGSVTRILKLLFEESQ